MYHKFVFFDVFSHSNGDNVETIGNFVETKFNSYFQFLTREHCYITESQLLCNVSLLYRR